MDAATLRAAEPRPKGIGRDWKAGEAEALIPGLRMAASMCELNTVNRMAMFLAQCGEESGSLYHTEEIADGSEYNGRTDLGNTQPGDGPRFKGRTFIQITGRNNYTGLSEWAFRHRAQLAALGSPIPSPSYFVDRPDRLASMDYVWLGPVWFWLRRHNHGYDYLNLAADAGDIVAATYMVNGAQHGIADRTQRWNRLRKMGAVLLFEEDDMPTAKEIVDELLEREITATDEHGDPILKDGKPVKRKVRQMLAYTNHGVSILLGRK